MSPLTPRRPFSLHIKFGPCGPTINPTNGYPLIPVSANDRKYLIMQTTPLYVARRNNGPSDETNPARDSKTKQCVTFAVTTRERE
ncbi:unnamed protein product, partial [Iphiclides podalirius]